LGTRETTKTMKATKKSLKYEQHGPLRKTRINPGSGGMFG